MPVYTETMGVRYRFADGERREEEDEYTIHVYHKGAYLRRQHIYLPKCENVFALVNHWNRDSAPHNMHYAEPVTISFALNY